MFGFTHSTHFVMAALEAAIQRRASARPKTLDGRVEPGHDEDCLGSGATATDQET